MKNKIFEYALCIASKELQGAIKRVSIEKGKVGKEDSFMLSIKTEVREGKNRCTLFCGSNTIQSFTTFYADLRITETKEDGKMVLLEEPLKHIVTVTMSGLLSEVVNTFAAVEDLIFLTVSNEVVIATNTVSQVPIPVKSNDISFVNSQNDKFEITLKREELVAALKYNTLAVNSNTPYRNSYGLMPIYQNEKAALNIVSMVSTEVVASTINIIKVNNSEYPTICERFSYAMLDAARVDQILAVTESEKVAIVFYHKDGAAGKEVVQVNFKTPYSMYMMTPFARSYPQAVTNVLKDGYESPFYGFSLNAKTLKSTLPILEIGCSSDEGKKIEIHVFKDHIVICDRLALDEQNVDSKEYGRTNIKDVITMLPENKEEEVFLMGLQQLKRSIKPYESKLTIQLSEKLVLLNGTNEHIKHGICICVDNKKSMKEEEDMKEIV